MPGELFLYFSDEMSDLIWVQAFQLLLQMFRELLADNLDIADDKINELGKSLNIDNRIIARY